MSKATDLNNVRYLIEAVDCGSFSAAARLFGVPPSFVSRKTARREEEVGFRLLQRTTRSLTLTDAGQTFLVHARAALQSFALAHDMLGNQQGILSGRIRLSAPVGAAKMVWAVVSRFLTRHPGVRVEMELGDRFVDLIEERFDLAIRSGAERRSDRLIGRRLLAGPRFLYASPGYLKEHGAPRTVSDLKNHACVIHGTRADRVTWHIHVGNRTHNVIVEGRVAVNEAMLAVECTLEGFGIAFLPNALCAVHLQTGRLERVLPRASAGDVGLWLVYPDRHLPPASRALVDVLLEELPTIAITGVRKE